jgi:predicted Zn-dependent peptidase
MIYLVRSDKKIGYDETDAVVVGAASAEKATQLARKEVTSWPRNCELVATPVSPRGKAEVILESFNAG